MMPCPSLGEVGNVAETWTLVSSDFRDSIRRIVLEGLSSHVSAWPHIGET